MLTNIGLSFAISAMDAMTPRRGISPISSAGRDHLYFKLMKRGVT